MVETVMDRFPDTINVQHKKADLSASTPGRAAGSGRFACPYCEDAVFFADENLWSHVQEQHVQQLDGLGLQTHGGLPLFRKLLRDEASHKAQRSTATPRDGRGEEPLRAKPASAEPVQELSPPATVAKMLRSPQREHHRKRSNGTSATSTQRSLAQKSEPRRSRMHSSPKRVHRDQARITGKTEPEVSTSVPRDGQPYSEDVMEYSVPSMPRKETPPSLDLLPKVQGHSNRPPDSSDTLGAREFIKEPDSRAISQDQLVAEVKSIYAGLAIIENKCISIDKAQEDNARDQDRTHPAPIPSEHWQALISLHRTLLHEHHDFFLASQHPEASTALRRLALKYSMPARMWKHAIHSFLELLRRRLPESLDYMLAFLYLAYQMVALLYETVPAFEETWIECLGDLGRYRMAIEDEDPRDREIWSGVARSWYLKATDKNPAIGRLYHHLAILSRPNALEQLYYYSKSLVCVQPFSSARESVLTLLDPFLGRARMTYSHASSMDTLFIKAHGMLYYRAKSVLDAFEGTLHEFVADLDAHVKHLAHKWREPGAYCAIINIASLFGYGHPESALRTLYEAAFNNATDPSLNSPNANADKHTASHLSPNTSAAQTGPGNPNIRLLDPQDQTFIHSCDITFLTLKMLLRRREDANVLPHIHIMLVFLRSLFQLHIRQYDCEQILQRVPWAELAQFLNTLKTSDESRSHAANRGFPHNTDSDRRPLPEDWMLRGQIWSQDYLPPKWFSEQIDEDERRIELASTTEIRTTRIAWLAHNIAPMPQDFLTFDDTEKAWKSQRSVEVEPHLSQRVDSMAIDSPPSDATGYVDVEMLDASNRRAKTQADMRFAPYRDVKMETSTL